MTTRVMGDATHANMPNLVAIKSELQVVAGYVTGSPDIKWTAYDWDEFKGKDLVSIDQGYTGSPMATATVRDVETGAWTPKAAVKDYPQWAAQRPTIYCSEDTLNAVVSLGWRGDVWLAKPENSKPTQPPPIHSVNVVAQQWTFDRYYDLSVVFDPDWPYVPSNRVWREWVTLGFDSLEILANSLETHPSTILRQTAIHYGAFDKTTAHWLDAIFYGRYKPTDPIPAGVHLWVYAPPK